MIVPHYCVCAIEGEPPSRIWVLADSESHARRLVSFNVGDAAEAADIDKYECHVDATHQPPYGSIYREGGAITPIAHR
jgi:hypothetical protein